MPVRESQERGVGRVKSLSPVVQKAGRFVESRPWPALVVSSEAAARAAQDTGSLAFVLRPEGREVVSDEVPGLCPHPSPAWGPDAVTEHPPRAGSLHRRPTAACGR